MSERKRGQGVGDVTTEPQYATCRVCGTKLYLHEIDGVCGLCVKGQTPKPPPGREKAEHDDPSLVQAVIEVLNYLDGSGPIEWEWVYEHLEAGQRGMLPNEGVSSASALNEPSLLAEPRCNALQTSVVSDAWRACLLEEAHEQNHEWGPWHAGEITPAHPVDDARLCLCGHPFELHPHYDARRCIADDCGCTGWAVSRAETDAR